MVDYRRNLSRQILNQLPDLDGLPVDRWRFYVSFKTGWQEWKKNGEKKQESSFLIFMNSMDVDAEEDLMLISQRRFARNNGIDLIVLCL